jgi:TPR repeat protein
MYPVLFRLLLILCLVLPISAATDSIPNDKIIDLYTTKESKRLADWFESTIQNRAKSQWKAPEQTYSSLTAFLFRLSADGEIRDVETVYNSASAALEASARAALIAVSPTPVKPPVVFNDQSVILFTFEHKVNEQEISEIDQNFKQNTDYLKHSRDYYLKLAEKNNPSVLYDLGEFHVSGIAPYKKDYNKAFSYFKRASDLGFVPAKNATAALYAIGLGTTKDTAKAIALFKEAADAGFISAQVNLARAYLHGEGTERNARQAALYYEKAAKKGSSLAERELKILNQLVKDNQI